MISLRSWPRWMVWLAVCLPLWANAFPAQEYSVRRWNAEQGLRQNRVSALCQTPDGYMWFGSWFGLVRFDGVRTTVFDHASNHEIVNDTVVGMVVDPATGTLWIGTDGGVVRYKDYQFAEIGGDAETPIGTGAMWVTGADTLWCQSHDLRSSRPLVCLRHGVPTVYSFAEIGQGIVWIADKGLGEAEILSERGFFRLTYSRPNPTVTREDVRLPPGRIKKVVKDSKGRLWFGTDQGLFVSRSGLLDVRTPPERVGGSVIGDNDIITLITPSHDGSMWFYVKNRGLFQWSEGQVYGLTGEASLANVQVEGLLEDRDNSLWVTTRTGVMQLRPKHVTVYSAADGLGHDEVWCVQESRDGVIWVGRVGGIDTIRDHHVNSLDIGSPFDSSNATADRRVQIVWPQEPNKLWYGPDQVRLLVDGHPAPTPFTFPPEAVHPESIFEDREHNMWFGAIGWALKWDGKQLQRFAVEPGENREAGVRVIFQDRVGRIWCGTYGQGITLLQGETNIVFKNPIPAGDSKRDRLERKLSNQMWTIHEDGNGIFWIGTENGLIRFVPPGVDPKLDALAPTNRFFTFRKENGLPDLVVNHVLEDDAGNLWLGALHGIYKVARSELNSVAAGTRSSTRFVRITGEDGLLSVETNGERSPSACKSRDGRLWFPTDIGVAVIDPTAIATKAYTPEVLIESVAIDHVLEYGGGEEFGGEVLPPSPSPSKRTSGGLLRLNPGRARLVRIKYTAPSTIGADQMDFSIQLVGVDTTIRQMRKERVVHYSNLPPGTYEFRVTATNGFGEGALRPATFAFVLEPFFWQTWPFKIFCVVVAIVVAGGIQTYRLRIQRRIGALENAASLEQERSRIAQDLHDELGSGLAQVALLAEMPESEATVRRRPQDVAREMLNKLDGIVWALNPARASLESVVDYLVGHAEEFLEPAGVHLRLHIVDNLPDSNLDAARRHHLLLVFKESLRNVVTHSQAKNVAVEIGIEPTGDILRLRVTVRDDGKGFDPLKLSGKRNGLTNMRERASQVGGEVTVKSSPGQGTEVVLAIPLVEVTHKRGRG